MYTVKYSQKGKYIVHTAKYIKTEKLSQVYKQYMSGTVLSLKGQCHEIFDPF